MKKVSDQLDILDLLKREKQAKMKTNRNPTVQHNVSIPYSRVDSYIRKSMKKKEKVGVEYGDRGSQIREGEAVERMGGVITI